MKRELDRYLAAKILSDFQSGVPALNILRQAYNDAKSFDREADFLNAAVFTCGTLISTGKQLGISYTGEGAKLISDQLELSLELNRHLHHKNEPAVDAIFQTISEALEQSRTFLPIGRIFFQRSFFEGTPTLQTDPVLKVQVVSMPTRETESSIERDGDGTIKKTTQVERDAFAGV